MPQSTELNYTSPDLESAVENGKYDITKHLSELLVAKEAIASSTQWDACLCEMQGLVVSKSAYENCYIASSPTTVSEGQQHISLKDMARHCVPVLGPEDCECYALRLHELWVHWSAFPNKLVKPRRHVQPGEETRLYNEIAEVARAEYGNWFVKYLRKGTFITTVPQQFSE